MYCCFSSSRNGITLHSVVFWRNFLYSFIHFSTSESRKGKKKIIIIIIIISQYNISKLLRLIFFIVIYNTILTLHLTPYKGAILELILPIFLLQLSNYTLNNAKEYLFILLKLTWFFYIFYLQRLIFYSQDGEKEKKNICLK
jgi:hypothetical protein